MSTNSPHSWRIVFDVPSDASFQPIESRIDCREAGIHVGKTVRIINQCAKRSVKYAVDDCEVREAERCVRVMLRPLQLYEAEQDRLPPLVSEMLNRVTPSQ